jgi:hypothetical protein
MTLFFLNGRRSQYFLNEILTNSTAQATWPSFDTPQFVFLLKSTAKRKMSDLKCGPRACDIVGNYILRIVWVLFKTKLNKKINLFLLFDICTVVFVCFLSSLLCAHMLQLILYHEGGIFLGNLGTGFPGNPWTSGEIFGRSHAFFMIYTSERHNFLL